MKTSTLKKQFLTISIIAVALLASVAKADKLQIQEKLGKTVKINLKNVTILEALEKISAEAEAPIILSDDAAWKLPYGEATRLSVELDGPLADSLTEMLNAFFMRYAVGADLVTIYPRPELDHIIGRPSTNQLQLLKEIYSKPICVYITNEVQTSINGGLGREVLISPLDVHKQLNESLRKLIGEREQRLQIPDIKDVKELVFMEKLPLDENGNELKEYSLPTPITLAQLLKDVYFSSSSRRPDFPSEWYIPAIDFPGQTPEIRVVQVGSLRTLRREQLLDIHYEDMNVIEILRDLAQRVNVFLIINSKMEFGQEKMSVSMQNITIPHAMERIADMANLIYQSRNQEFIVEGIKKPKEEEKPSQVVQVVRPATTATRPTPSSAYVGKISIPMEDGKYFIEFMLREDDLTEELKKLRKEKMTDILGDTRPATPSVPTPRPRTPATPSAATPKPKNPSTTQTKDH
jgi:hypothetical protein